MTCKQCNKKVRGRPAPSGLCKKCRGLDGLKRVGKSQAGRKKQR